MKNKIIDKKIIFLFIIMIMMVIFMMRFLNQQKNDLENKNINKLDNRLSILEQKQKKINKFLKNVNNTGSLFGSGLQEIFVKLDLKSYIKLPLKIDSNYNTYPFGNGQEED